MTFFDYYRNISDKGQKRAFRKRIIDVCKIEHATFYSWMHRNKVPALAQSVIAEIMQKPQNELFPKNEIDSII